MDDLSLSNRLKAAGGPMIAVKMTRGTSRTHRFPKLTLPNEPIVSDRTWPRRAG